MSSSGDNSDKNVNKSSNEDSGHIVDRDRYKAIFTFSDMPSPSSDRSITSSKRKERTPLRRVLEAATDSESAQKRKRAGTTTGETWSMLEEFLETQTIIPSQKRKRVSFTELSGTPNRLLSSLPSPRPESQQDFATPKPSEGKKKRVSFAGISGAPKRSSATPKKRISTPLKKKPKTLTTTTTAAPKYPKYPKYPKLPPTPTYRSSIPKPSSPEPINEGSFHDLAEENNLLRTRVQASDELEDMILAAAVPIGAIAFSDASPTNVVDPVRQTLREIDRPAAEACLVLIDKLTETQAGLAASRTDGMEQFIKFEEADEEARRGKILVERIGLLEESNEVLEAEKDELNRLCLSRYLTAQQRGQHIKALVESSKRFKEIQINDKVTIVRLQKEVNNLEQQEATFAKSAEVYIKQLSEKGGITAEPQSNTYSAETMKAAKGLAEVMDLLSGKNYIDPAVLDNPIVLIVDLVRGFSSKVLGKEPDITSSGSKAPEESRSQPDQSAESIPVSNIDIDIIESLANIADDDPCRGVKILLRENQANWEKRQAEWEEVLRTQNEKATDLLQRVTDQRDEINDIYKTDTERAFATAKIQAEEIKQATEALIQCEAKYDATIKQLEAQRSDMKNLQVDKGASERVAELLERLQDMTSQVQNLSKTASGSSIDAGTIGDLKKQTERLQRINTGLRNESLTQLNAISNMKFDISDLENCRREIALLRAEIKTLRAEIALLNSQRNDGLEARKQFSELQKASAARMETLQTERANLEAEINKLRNYQPPETGGGANVSGEAASDEKDGEIKDLRAEIDKLKSEETARTAGGGGDPCAEEKRQLLELQGLSDKKDDQIKALTAEIDKLKSEETARTAGGGGDPCAEEKRQLLELRGLSDEKDGEIKDLRAEIDRLENEKTARTAGGGGDPCAEEKRQLLELRGLSDEKDGEIKDLRAEIDRLENEKTARTAEDIEIKEQFLKVQAMFSRKNGQIRDLRTEILRLESAGIAEDGFDPCAEVKGQLLDLQGLSDEKDGEIKDLRAEIDKLKSDKTVRTAGGGGDPCAEEKRQLLELQRLSDKKDDQIKALTAEIDKLKAMLKRPNSVKDPLELQGRLDNVRRRLKIRKQREIDLERALTRMKALRAAPSQGEFERRLQEITAAQKLIYVKRINRLYRTKQEQMFPAKSQQDKPTVFPPASLRDFLRQDGPPIKEISDRWFAIQWDELYDQVAILCQINYCARSDHLQYDYLRSAANDELISYYLRDTVVSENAMHDRINSVDVLYGFTYRTKVAMAIVFRILVEEIFNPMRFLLNMQFPDSTRWKTKLQFRQAFEQLDNPLFLLPGTKRGFQEKESWCTRKAAATGSGGYRPRRQRDENFNYFKQIEEMDYDGKIGDALILNTARAKMMLAMFQTVDDSILHERFQAVRANVSMLIRDTLAPLRLPRAGAPPLGEREAWDGAALKLGVEEIIKFAFNLAITMRSQRRIIYVNLEQLELSNMMSFKTATMTDVEQPESRRNEARDKHDETAQTTADGYEGQVINSFGKVEVMVQPALWRKGSENGNFSATNIRILRKSKVIYGKGVQSNLKT